MSKLIKRADEEKKTSATAQAHGFVYVDKLLKMKTDGFQIQMTVGWETPQESYSPVVTAAMPAPFAKELAEALLEAYKDAEKKRGAE